MQNQRQFVVKFTLIFLLASAGMSFIASAMQLSAASPDQMSQTQLAQEMIKRFRQPSRLIFFLLNQCVTLFISSWVLATVHSISRQQGMDLMSSVTLVLRRFGGIVALTVLSVLPLFAGLWSALGNMRDNQAPSVLSLFLIIVGIIVFIRLCLAPVGYLIRSVSLQSAVKNILVLGTKRVSTLFFYCLIANFFLPLIGLQLSAIAVNIVLSIIALIAIALISIFSLVFTYRFYSIFSDRASYETTA